MPRPPRSDRPTRVEISLPESLRDRIGMLLYSPAEQCIPKGAWSQFFERLARQALARLESQEPSNGTDR
jgi:hypothetical protein